MSHHYREINGPDNAETVMIIPALSASSHICSNASEPKSGWWEGELISFLQKFQTNPNPKP